MSTKHTPGPWHVQHSEGFPVCDARALVVTHPCGEDLEADARLIAAAPELLAALGRVTEFLAANYSDADMPDILPACRAAIAKATGVQS